jgi:hypothetical protein
LPKKAGLRILVINRAEVYPDVSSAFGHEEDGKDDGEFHSRFLQDGGYGKVSGGIISRLGFAPGLIKSVAGRVGDTDFKRKPPQTAKIDYRTA